MRIILPFLCLLLAACSTGVPAALPAVSASTPAAAAAAPAEPSAAEPAARTEAPTEAPTAEPISIVLPTPTPEPTPTPAPPSCAEQSAEFAAQLDELLREWDDALTLAARTPRIQLAEQIERLQALRRQAEDLDAPVCALQVKGLLLESMGQAIFSLFDFLEQNTFSVGSEAGIQFSRNNIARAQNALTVMADYPDDWTPYTTDDIKAMFPQYQWEDQTRREGTTVIGTADAPISISASHIDGIVYSVSASAFMYDPAEHAEKWTEIQSAALPFLAEWPDAERRLREFGAVEPVDGEVEPIEERLGAMTIRVTHSRYESPATDIAIVSISFLHKDATGE